jgi:integrase
MASIQPTAKGYRAQVAILGQRDSKTCRTRREAEAWASARETELRRAATLEPGKRVTLRQALERYVAEITPGKRGARGETLRIAAFLRHRDLPLDAPLADLLPDDFQAWRTTRLGEVATSSVLRDMNILSAVLQQCKKEWRYIKESPFSDVRRPTQPDHRTVTITWRQARAMVTSMGYRPGRPIRTTSQALAVAFLMSLYTGMRQGEVCGLEWRHVHDDYVELPVTKTTSRDVPLSKRARRLLQVMQGWDCTYVFGLNANSSSTLFTKYRKRLGLDGFTFHDARHTAATVISRKVDVLTLCKIFGWKDPKFAMIYYNPKPSDVAKMLG